MAAGRPGRPEPQPTSPHRQGNDAPMTANHPAARTAPEADRLPSGALPVLAADLRDAVDRVRDAHRAGNPA
ncbi:predicted protein [Streptomyces sp. AA4]|nr:predicted protein [Streptomyces sp. AA4]